MEKAMATHSSTLAWKIPWVEEPDRLQSLGSLRVGHDWATEQQPQLNPFAVQQNVGNQLYSNHFFFKCVFFVLFKNFISVRVCWVTSVTSDSLWAPGLQPTRLLCPWDSPGKNTGVGCRALLQGIFPIQGRKRGPGFCIGRQVVTTSTNWEARPTSHCP